MAKTKDDGFIMDEYMISSKTQCIDCQFLSSPTCFGWICKKYPSKIPSKIWREGNCQLFVRNEDNDNEEIVELEFDED